MNPIYNEQQQYLIEQITKNTSPKTGKNYYVGGRDISSTHVGLSISATDVGGGFSIGLGGLGYAIGLFTFFRKIILSDTLEKSGDFQTQ